MKLRDLNETFEIEFADHTKGVVKFEHGYGQVLLTVKAEDKWTNNVTIHGLPVGTYIVLEENPDIENYKVNVSEQFKAVEVKKTE